MGFVRPYKLLHQRDMVNGWRSFVQVVSQFMNTHGRDAIWSGCVSHFHEAVVGDECTSGGVGFWLGTRDDVDIEFGGWRIGFDESRHLAGEPHYIVASQDLLNLPNASFHRVVTRGLPPRLETSAKVLNRSLEKRGLVRAQPQSGATLEV